MDPYILENGRLPGVLIDSPSFPGWDSFAALVEHVKFVREHQHNIDRIAAVSDSAVPRMAPAIGRHFADPKIRSFDTKDQASSWLQTGH